VVVMVFKKVNKSLKKINLNGKILMKNIEWNFFQKFKKIWMIFQNTTNQKRLSKMGKGEKKWAKNNLNHIIITICFKMVQISSANQDCVKFVEKIIYIDQSSLF
jgi:hypothetical protein